MTKTGPQKYPGASTAYWYQDDYPGAAMETNVGVLHTTEGTSLPSYGGGANAPHFTAVPDIPNRRLRWYQHFDFDTSARALVNASGGVETNTLNCVQVELVGTCDPATRDTWGESGQGTSFLYWPEAPDWALAELAAFVKWSHDEHGVKLASTVTWKAYPASYGTSNGVRLTGSQWQDYYGWLGHQHVPENTHGDPGALDFARVLAHAAGTEEESDEMPHYVNLGMTKPLTDLAPGVWVSLPWDTEWTDTGNAHPSEARTFAGPGQFNGTCAIEVTGLTPGAGLQARVAEDDADGTTVVRHPIDERPGTAGSTFLTLPMSGRVPSGHRAKVLVCHYGDGPVTVKYAVLKAQTWPA